MALNDEQTGSRLDGYMDRRRKELRLSWEDVAKGVDVTSSHLRRIRRTGVGFSGELGERLEETLQWKPGSIAAIQQGGDPTKLRQDATAMPETVTARAVIPTPTVTAAPTPGEGESVGVAQVDAIRAAMRAELTALRDESRQRDEENKAALARMADANKAALAEVVDELRAFREQRGA